MRRRLPVVLVTDDHYAGFAAVACTSLLESARQPEQLELHILFDSLRPDSLQRLQRIVDERGGAARFYDLRPVVAGDRRFRGLSSHFYRLLAPAVLPPEVDRFIYLDCDVVVKSDLQALAREDLGGKVAAACRDYLGSIRDAVANHRLLGLAGGAPYFNSGVMVVDRSAWQRHRVAERALACTRANARHLYAQGRFFQYEQYALNVVLYRRWVMLDSYWNYGAEYPFREAGIIHFNGHGKPWSATCTREFRDDFYSCLERAGWDESELGGWNEEGAEGGR